MTANGLKLGRMLILTMLAGLAGACGDQPVSAARELEAELQLAIVSGQNQVAEAGKTLAAPIVVKVTRRNGQVVSNQIVNFIVTAGGGSVFAGTAMTNAEGNAQEWWTLGAEPGANSVEARAVDSQTGERLVFATFTATGAPEAPVVNRVSVTPATVALTGVGSTSVLSAVAHDQFGNPISTPFTWQSLSASVATVSSTGVVTAVAAGTAQVVASAAGKADTTAVTVTVTTSEPPPPPPPSGDAIFSADFESGSLSGWDDGLDPTKHRILTDATLAHSGSRLLEMSYPSGGNAGWLTEFFMPGYEALKVSYWVRLSSNWTGGTKLIGLRGSPTDNQWGAFGKAGVCPNGTDFFSTGFSAEPSGNPGPVHFYTYYPGMPNSSGSCWGSIGQGTASYDASVVLAKDKWQHVEMEVRLNTPGQSNGSQKLWIDGKVRGTWTGIRFRDTDKLRLNSIMLSGDATGASAQKLYVDDLVVTPLSATTPEPEPEPEPAPRTVSSVSASPTEVSLTSAGQTRQLAATARDQFGDPITTSFSWRSLNAAAATVSSTGLTTAVATGTAQVVATSGGYADTVRVAVEIPTTPPPPPPTQGTAPEPAASSVILHRDDFDRYTTIDGGSNPLGGTYAITPAHPTLVTGRGTSGRAVRFSYRPGVSDILIEKSFSASTDIFIRYWFRTSAGADPTMGGSATDGMKWFMAHRSGGQRYTMGVNSIAWSAGPTGFRNTGLEFTSHDNGSQQMPNPFVQNISKTRKFGAVNDGQWHRYTVQIRTGNAGFERIWIDGELMLDSAPGAPGVPSSGYDHQSGGISAISFPGTVVSGVRSGWEFHVEVDDLVVWRQ